MESSESPPGAAFALTVDSAGVGDAPAPAVRVEKEPFQSLNLVPDTPASRCWPSSTSSEVPGPVGSGRESGPVGAKRASPLPGERKVERAGATGGTGEVAKAPGASAELAPGADRSPPSAPGEAPSNKRGGRGGGGKNRAKDKPEVGSTSLSANAKRFIPATPPEPGLRPSEPPPLAPPPPPPAATEAAVLTPVVPAVAPPSEAPSLPPSPTLEIQETGSTSAALATAPAVSEAKAAPPTPPPPMPAPTLSPPPAAPPGIREETKQQRSGSKQSARGDPPRQGQAPLSGQHRSLCLEPVPAEEVRSLKADFQDHHNSYWRARMEESDVYRTVRLGPGVIRCHQFREMLMEKSWAQRVVNAWPSTWSYSFDVLLTKTTNSFVNVGLVEWVAAVKEDLAAGGTASLVATAAAANDGPNAGTLEVSLARLLGVPQGDEWTTEPSWQAVTENPRQMMLGFRKGVKWYGNNISEPLFKDDLCEGTQLHFRCDNIFDTSGRVVKVQLWLLPSPVIFRTRGWQLVQLAKPIFEWPSPCLWEDEFGSYRQRRGEEGSHRSIWVPAATLFSKDDAVVFAWHDAGPLPAPSPPLPLLKPEPPVAAPSTPPVAPPASAEGGAGTAEADAPPGQEEPPAKEEQQAKKCIPPWRAAERSGGAAKNRSAATAAAAATDSGPPS